MSAFKRLVLSGILTVGAPLALCGPAVAQDAWPCKWALQLDSRRASQLFERSSATPSVYDVLSGALTVSTACDGGRPGAVVLYAFRVRDRKVVAKFQSKPFEVEPGRAIRVSRTAIPPPASYGDAPLADPQGYLPALETVPAESAVREALRYVIDGIFDKPPDWEHREMLYLVAMPALDGSSKDAGSTSPLLVVYSYDVSRRR
jgi:hypothetical protein